jgi:ATP adenylyltransferase/5',5'''-P-1,P-4-tetraphosphate phosphorylase II
MLNLKNSVLTCARESLRLKTSFKLFLEGKEIIIKDKNLDFCFHFYDPKVNSKPQHPQILEKSPLLPPYQKSVEAAHLKNGAGHYVMITKYMFKAGHVLLSSDDEKASQLDHLNDLDFNAISQILHSFDNEGIIYYNFGMNSGCTQLHKHFHYVPENFNPLVSAMKQKIDLPFKYFFEQCNQLDPFQLKQSYNRIADSALRKTIDSVNFLVAGNSIFGIPRKIAEHRTGIVINSMGLAGHFFVWEWTSPEVFQNPLQILSEVCVPVD